ncbi:pre-mRNA-processing factor 39-like isoform X2 [Cygnus olor]|nr:pre-mRNA-processing factor 39-like isoform X2 [Cygnus olor]
MSAAPAPTPRAATAPPPPPPSPRSPLRPFPRPPPAPQDPEPPADEAAPGYPPDFEKFWRAARDNPHDFTAWTELLQYVEQENHLPAARKAFDAFFSHYPYCYGYWKKYADMERRFHCGPETEEVRGVPGRGGFGGRAGILSRFWGPQGVLGCYTLLLSQVWGATR